MMSIPSFGADAMTANARDALVRGADERGVFLGGPLLGQGRAFLRVPCLIALAAALPEVLG
jgi:hypothetical protein